MVASDNFGKAEAHGERGQVHMSRGEYVKARHEFDQAIQLEPNLIWVNFGRGQANGALRRFDDALEDFTRVIELAPHAANGFACRGEIYLMLGQFEEAGADFDYALGLDPNHTSAINGRNAIPRMSYDEALQLAEQFGCLEPQTVKERIAAGIMGSEAFKQSPLAQERRRLWAEDIRFGRNPRTTRR
jgi:tetratricopeptide (TPR) repeat protein